MQNNNQKDSSNNESHQESQENNTSNGEASMPNDSQTNQNFLQQKNQAEEVEAAANFSSLESIVTNENSINKENGLNENCNLSEDFNKYNCNYEGDDDEKIKNFDFHRINSNKKD